MLQNCKNTKINRLHRLPSQGFFSLLFCCRPAKHIKSCFSLCDILLPDNPSSSLEKQAFPRQTRHAPPLGFYCKSSPYGQTVCLRACPRHGWCLPPPRVVSVVSTGGVGHPYAGRRPGRFLSMMYRARGNGRLMREMSAGRRCLPYRLFLSTGRMPATARTVPAAPESSSAPACRGHGSGNTGG